MSYWLLKTVLLAIKTQESGKIKWLFSNVLKSSAFFYAIKSDFVFKRVSTFLYKTFSSITSLISLIGYHIVISMYNYFKSYSDKVQLQ